MDNEQCGLCVTLAPSRSTRSSNGCSTVVLICITCPAITVATVILWALDRVRGRALGCKVQVAVWKSKSKKQIRSFAWTRNREVRSCWLTMSTQQPFDDDSQVAASKLRVQYRSKKPVAMQAGQLWRPRPSLNLVVHACFEASRLSGLRGVPTMGPRWRPFFSLEWRPSIDTTCV